MAVAALSAVELRALSRVDFDELGLAVVQQGDPPDDFDPLGRLLDRAVAYVLDVTGWPDLDTLPDARGVVFEEATQMRAEQLALQGTGEGVESGADELVSSFGAGAYNESRRSLTELAEAKLINRWPALHDVLWRLCTDDKRQWWIAFWQQLLSTDPEPSMAFVDIEVASPPGSIGEFLPRERVWWP